MKIGSDLSLPQSSGFDRKSTSAQSTAHGCCTEVSSCWDIRTVLTSLRTRRVVWRRLYWVFFPLDWRVEETRDDLSGRENTSKKDVLKACFMNLQQYYTGSFCTSLKNVSCKSIYSAINIHQVEKHFLKVCWLWNLAWSEQHLLCIYLVIQELKHFCGHFQDFAAERHLIGY